MSTPLSTAAHHFAAHAHRNHVRNDSAKTPYIHHLTEVADLVTQSGGSDQEIAAAWLHDTVEDTDTTIEDIRREFGDEIAHVVEGVTDLKEWLPLPLSERKAKQAERVGREIASIRRVKLADQASNVRITGPGLDSYDIQTRRTYITSAKKIADACAGVSPFLDNIFADRFEEARKNID